MKYYYIVEKKDSVPADIVSLVSHNVIKSYMNSIRDTWKYAQTLGTI
jgi:hypothetical protein